MSKERYATEEEKLANVPNAFPINTSDNSHDNTSEAGKQISKEVNRGKNPAELDPIPSDATEGHVEPRTEFDNGVHVPKEGEELGGGKKLTDKQAKSTEVKAGQAIDRTEENVAPRDVNAVDTSAKGNPKVGNKKSATKQYEYCCYDAQSWPYIQSNHRRGVT